jgi:hypothetical protein
MTYGVSPAMAFAMTRVLMLDRAFARTCAHALQAYGKWRREWLHARIVNILETSTLNVTGPGQKLYI